MVVHTIVGGQGVHLAVEETGNSAGIPLIFLHGFSQSSLCWLPQRTPELEQHYRLIAPDCRGHGRSAKPEEQQAYTDSRLWAEDIQSIITTLGLDRPVLIGWSYGGVMICDYLRFYGQASLRGIVFVGAVSKLGAPVLPLLGADFVALFDGLFANDVRQSTTALQQFLRLMVSVEPAPRDLYLWLGYNSVVPPSVRAHLFARTLTNDDLLTSLTLPTLLIHGEQDVIVLPAATHEHHRMVPHAQTLWYPQVGHAPFWEDSTRFNHDIRTFVEGLVA